MESEPRWLDADEQETWMALAAVLMRLPGALDAQLQRDAGLTHFEYLVLSGLSMAPGRTMRMSDLAAAGAHWLRRAGPHPPASPRWSPASSSEAGCAAHPTPPTALPPSRS